MITTAIVLPVRYYPLSALLPAFLPAVEKKKKKNKRTREGKREGKVGRGRGKVGRDEKWMVGKNWKRRSLELSVRSIFQTTDETLGREGWRRGL